ILEAGRHVVCEKPLAMTAAESSELVAVAERSRLVNAVNFNIRFYPVNQHAHDLVAEGGLGDVRFVTGRYFQDWLLLDTDWNSLQWEIDGSLGAAAWDSEAPDHLWLGHRDRPNEVLQRNPALMSAGGRAATALPAGHTEGFGDTFGALFRAIYADVASGRPAE